METAPPPRVDKKFCVREYKAQHVPRRHVGVHQMLRLPDEGGYASRDPTHLGRHRIRNPVLVALDALPAVLRGVEEIPQGDSPRCQLMGANVGLPPPRGETHTSVLGCVDEKHLDGREGLFLAQVGEGARSLHLHVYTCQEVVPRVETSRPQGPRLCDAVHVHILVSGLASEDGGGVLHDPEGVEADPRRSIHDGHPFLPRLVFPRTFLGEQHAFSLHVHLDLEERCLGHGLEEGGEAIPPKHGEQVAQEEGSVALPPIGAQVSDEASGVAARHFGFFRTPSLLLLPWSYFLNLRYAGFGIVSVRNLWGTSPSLRKQR